MGQIVSIGHNISLETPFKSYNDFQIHWNMLVIKTIKCLFLVLPNYFERHDYIYGNYLQFIAIKMFYIFLF